MVPMMDEEDSQVPVWSYRVNLDKRVRSDHPLRRIRSASDLSFVRKAVAHTYGRKGNGSLLDPGVKFGVPTTFSGKVYVGTSNSLAAFGL
jgi:hypothetical protein